jgi:hypothetical protein
MEWKDFVRPDLASSMLTDVYSQCSSFLSSFGRFGNWVIESHMNSPRRFNQLSDQLQSPYNYQINKSWIIKNSANLIPPISNNLRYVAPLDLRLTVWRKTSIGSSTLPLLLRVYLIDATERFIVQFKFTLMLININYLINFDINFNYNNSHEIYLMLVLLIVCIFRSLYLEHKICLN